MAQDDPGGKGLVLTKEQTNDDALALAKQEPEPGW